MADLSDDIASPCYGKRWLWATRGLAITPVLAVIALSLRAWVPALWNPCAEGPPPIALVALLLVVLPYVISSIHLSGRSPERVKRGLAWAVVSGSFWGGIALLLPVLVNGKMDPPTAIGGTLAALSQGVLVGCAIKTYSTMARAPGDGRILGGRILLFVPYLIFVVVMLTNASGVRSRQAASQASAVQGLRTIDAAEATYRQEYLRGYSRTLDALGPSPKLPSPDASGADLIDELLARGRKGDYIFTYTAGPPNAAGEISSYALTADPDPPCTGWNHYFTDETGVIRQTQENRPATVRDPTLGG